MVLAGVVEDGGGDQPWVALVEAGDGVAEADGVAGCEAGRDSDDALFPAGCWQAPAVKGGHDRVPVDPRHRGAVADAGRGLYVAGGAGEGQEGAVADDQPGPGLVGVDACGCGEQRGAELAGHSRPPRSCWVAPGRVARSDRYSVVE